MIKPDTHPTHRRFNRIKIWLVFLTCFVAGWWADTWIKDKRQNYKEHWRIQSDHEVRIQKLEER